MEKVQWNSIDKKQNGLKYSKNDKSSTLPRGKKQVPFSMAIGNEELMHECFPKHLCMGTTRMTSDKETVEECKKSDVSMERSKAGTKEKEVPTAYHCLTIAQDLKT